MMIGDTDQSIEKVESHRQVEKDISLCVSEVEKTTPLVAENDVPIVEHPSGDARLNSASIDERSELKRNARRERRKPDLFTITSLTTKCSDDEPSVRSEMSGER